MKTLKSTALLYPAKRTRRTMYQPFSTDEVELYIAYLEQEITFGQLRFALGRSYGYAANWCRRMTEWLFMLHELQLRHKERNIVWRQKETALA